MRRPTGSSSISRLRAARVPAPVLDVLTIQAFRHHEIYSALAFPLSLRLPQAARRVQGLTGVEAIRCRSRPVDAVSPPPERDTVTVGEPGAFRQEPWKGELQLSLPRLASLTTTT